MGWGTVTSEEYIWVAFSCCSSALYVVILYIIISGRSSNQNVLFNAPFFTITLIQAAHGVLLFLTVNFVMRPRKFRLIAYPITDDSKLVEYTYYWYSFLKNNLFLSYLVVAANRMTVFAFQASYKKIWSNATLYGITLVGYVLLLLLRYISHQPGYKFATSVDFAADLFMFTVPPAMDFFDSIVDIVLSLGSGTICIILYLITACGVKRVSITGNRRLIILRSAFLTFLLMVPSAIRGGLQCYSIAYNDETVKQWSNKAATYFVEGMFVAEPWILLLTFHTIRQKVAVIVGSVIVSGSTAENVSSTVGSHAPYPMFVIPRQ